MQRYPAATREQVENLLRETQAFNGHGRKPPKKWTVRRIVNAIVSLIVILTLLFTLFSLIRTKINGGYPELFGYRIFRVETGSMIPTLPIGSIIIVHKPDDPYGLQVGTVITYRYETAVVTHRIVNIDMQMDANTGEYGLVYQTKGDNPDNSLDPWKVSPEDILGEMIWHFSF